MCTLVCDNSCFLIPNCHLLRFLCTLCMKSCPTQHGFNTSGFQNSAGLLCWHKHTLAISTVLAVGLSRCEFDCLILSLTGSHSYYRCFPGSPLNSVFYLVFLWDQGSFHLMGCVVFGLILNSSSTKNTAF